MKPNNSVDYDTTTFEQKLFFLTNQTSSKAKILPTVINMIRVRSTELNLCCYSLLY
jgi:hypothetical protein